MDTGLYGSRRWGVALGLLATAAGLGAAELVAGLVQGAASPVVPVGQVFIDHVPPGVKEWAIETFGTADKVVLVTGAVIVVLGLGALAGVLAMRGARAPAYALAGAIGMIGVWAVVVRPDPDLGGMMPSIVGTAVSIGVLWWLGPRRPPADAPPDGARAAAMVGPDRRQFITGAVAIGSAAAVMGGLGRLLRERFDIGAERAALSLPPPEDAAGPLPQDAQLGVEGIESFVVPNGDFYRIDTALVVPQVRADDWTLTVGGLVDRELELTFADLLARPQVERYVTLSCVSNEVGGDLVGNARWQGVLLRDVLEEAGLQDGAEQVVSRSVDGWTAGTPVEAVMDGRAAMLAVGMNGEPLPAQHGYPVRLVVPGLYGYVSATKWVTEIRLTRWDAFDAYWVPRGWAKRAPVKTMARIDTPRSGATRTGTVPIGGVAWAVHRGVSRVQVRIDGGPWHDAELGGVPSTDTWVQWVYRWASEPGEHVVEARAIDGAGVPQPSAPAPPAPDGAQGYHRIRLVIG